MSIAIHKLLYIIVSAVGRKLYIRSCTILCKDKPYICMILHINAVVGNKKTLTKLIPNFSSLSITYNTNNSRLIHHCMSISIYKNK